MFGSKAATEDDLNIPLKKYLVCATSVLEEERELILLAISHAVYVMVY